MLAPAPAAAPAVQPSCCPCAFFHKRDGSTDKTTVVATAGLSLTAAAAITVAFTTAPVWAAPTGVVGLVVTAVASFITSRFDRPLTQ